MWQRVTPGEAIGGRGMVPRHYLAIGVRPLAKMAACADEIRHFVVEQDIGPPDDGCSIRLRPDLVVAQWSSSMIAGYLPAILFSAATSRSDQAGF